MSKPRNKIKVGAYVQLKEGFDETDFYRSVEAGATGWVTDCKIDEGFPMVFIEWDEANPKYAGEKDKWVYESHFTVLADEDGMMENYINSIRQATDAALAGEAFIMISVSRTVHPITGRLMFKPFIVSSDLNDQASYVLEAQIVFAASQLFNNYIQDTIDLAKKEKEKENESGRKKPEDNESNS